MNETVTKLMGMIDTYADGPHTEGYYGAHRKALKDELTKLFTPPPAQQPAPQAQQPAPVQEPSQRQLDTAMRQWESWKTYALELQEKLVKYEGGSPMILNDAQQPRKVVKLTDDEISDIAIDNPPDVHVYARAIEAAVLKANEVCE